MQLVVAHTSTEIADGDRGARDVSFDDGLDRDRRERRDRPRSVRSACTSVTVPVTIASAPRVSASSLMRTIVVARAGDESSSSNPPRAARSAG
jgi:hypothetical protein